MERRLTAVVAADIVDYSRLLGENEEQLLAILDEARTIIIDPALAATSGRIIRLLGDGTLITFGSVFEAMTFAIALHRGMERLNARSPDTAPILFRIGVSLGDIVQSGGSTNTAPWMLEVCQVSLLLLSYNHVRIILHARQRLQERHGGIAEMNGFCARLAIRQPQFFLL